MYCREDFDEPLKYLKWSFYIIALSLLFQTIAVSSPYWSTVFENKTIMSHEGLWEHCEQNVEFTCCQDLDTYLYSVNNGISGISQFVGIGVYNEGYMKETWMYNTTVFWSFYAAIFSALCSTVNIVFLGVGMISRIDMLKWPFEDIGEDKKRTKIRIDNESDDYKTVCDKFVKAFKNEDYDEKDVEIISIYRIRNPVIYRPFVNIRDSLPDGGNKVEKLWHGVGFKEADAIIEHGFYRSYKDKYYSDKTEIHFTVSSSDSFDVATPDVERYRKIFYCQVVVGNYIAEPRGFYDALVDDKENPTEFTVTHDTQAYPEYLLTFKIKDGPLNSRQDS